MLLRPQDVVVAAKLVSYGGKRPPMARMGLELALSASEVHASIHRLQAAHLIHGASASLVGLRAAAGADGRHFANGLLESKPNVKAIEEFFLHGVKYFFPAERGELTRGVPTSYAAEPLKRRILVANETPLVWPYAEGEVRGESLQPFYKGVPVAALRDPFLHEILALLDALREGRAREQNIAERELVTRLNAKRHA